MSWNQAEKSENKKKLVQVKIFILGVDLADCMNSPPPPDFLEISGHLLEFGRNRGNSGNYRKTQGKSVEFREVLYVAYPLYEFSWNCWRISGQCWVFWENLALGWSRASCGL